MLNGQLITPHPAAKGCRRPISEQYLVILISSRRRSSRNLARRQFLILRPNSIIFNFFPVCQIYLYVLLPIVYIPNTLTPLCIFCVLLRSIFVYHVIFVRQRNKPYAFTLYDTRDCCQGIRARFVLFQRKQWLLVLKNRLIIIQIE